MERMISICINLYNMCVLYMYGYLYSEIYPQNLNNITVIQVQYTYIKRILIHTVFIISVHFDVRVYEYDVKMIGIKNIVFVKLKSKIVLKF